MATWEVCFTTIPGKLLAGGHRDAIVTCLPVTVSFTECADTADTARLQTCRKCSQPQAKACMEVLVPTGRVRQAPPFSIGPGRREEAWLLSCNFPSYQQVMLSPIWRGKEGCLFCGAWWQMPPGWKPAGFTENNGCCHCECLSQVEAMLG